MTVESLMNKFTQYVSWLYSQREWARWELLTVATTALVLLLFLLIHRRRAKARRTEAKQIKRKHSTIGINLDDRDDSDGRSSVSFSKNNVNQKRWKETTKKWKNLQKLIEQLQEETAKYKQAEEALEKQFIKLKAANEQLRQEIVGSEQIIQETEFNQPHTLGSFGNTQSRILNPSGAIAEGS